MHTVPRRLPTTALPVLRPPPPYHPIHYQQYYAIPEPPPYRVESTTNISSDEGLFDFQWHDIFSKTDLTPDDIDYLASLRPLPSHIAAPQLPSISSGYASGHSTDPPQPSSATGAIDTSEKFRPFIQSTTGASTLWSRSQSMFDNTSQNVRPGAHPPDARRPSQVDSSGNKPVPGPYRALHIAAGNGHDRSVRVLLDRDVDCEERDSSGRTALTLAVINGHEAVVRTLLAHGARIDAADDERRSALHWAVLYRRETILNMLLDHSNQDRDVNIDAYENGGWTPLHIAVEKGFEAGMLRLIQCGADLHFRVRRNPVNGAIVYTE